MCTVRGLFSALHALMWSSGAEAFVFSLRRENLCFPVTKNSRQTLFNRKCTKVLKIVLHFEINSYLCSAVRCFMRGAGQCSYKNGVFERLSFWNYELHNFDHQITDNRTRRLRGRIVARRLQNCPPVRLAACRFGWFVSRKFTIL